MTERVLSKIDRFYSRIVTFCAVGTCLCLGWLAYQQVLYHQQARQGQKAREVQLARQPSAVKLYTWAATDPRSHITSRDVACIRDSSKCPAPKPTP